jgi:hypothetical protein
LFQAGNAISGFVNLMPLPRQKFFEQRADTWFIINQ